LSIAGFQAEFENASNATPIIKSLPCRDNAAVETPLLSLTMQLDHATIVTAEPETVRRFFVDIAGLSDGARPPFSVDGYWLYANGRPVVHLIGAPASGVAARVSPRISPRIDHIAFRFERADEWQALLERLDTRGIGYQTAQVPASAAQPAERQLFVALAPGVVIEFVTAAQPAVQPKP
jgi:catechol 2,3-dioxygenase-like lactoylglutathione lyase family enzyme